MHLPAPARLCSLLLPGVAAAALALVGLGAGAAAAPAVPPGGPVAQANGASVSLSRTRVRAGGRIRVVGRGWRSRGSRLGSGAVVTVKLDDRDVLATFRLRRGRFAGWVRIPRPVRAGRHRLRFLAARPATSVRSRTFRVTR